MERDDWYEGTNLPQQGKMLFYGGGEHQFLAFVDYLMRSMMTVDSSQALFAWLVEVRKFVHSPEATPEKVYAKIFGQEKARFFGIHHQALSVLQRLGYDLAYDPERELYSGALLRELGFTQALMEYGIGVAEHIRATGCETIVCTSPHSAEMFRFVYPELIEFPIVEVKTFVELVYERRDQLPKHAKAEQVVIHDACLFARELRLSGEIRGILQAMGTPYVDPVRSREWTSCCGGLRKVATPELARLTGTRRITELAATGARRTLVTCPYCLHVLNEGAAKIHPNMVVEDSVEYIAQAYHHTSGV